MRRVLLALGILLSLCVGADSQTAVGPPNQILCNQVAQISVASATTTSVVAGTATGHIFICGWEITTSQAAATNTFQFEYGTQGGPCTTPTTITPALNISSSAPAVDHVDYAQIEAPLGAQLCVVTAGTTVGIAGIVFYNQF